MYVLKKTAVAALASLMLLTTAALANQGGKNSMDQMHASSDHKQHMVRKVIAAVSQTGLNAQQVQAVTDAINTFKAKRMEAKASKTFPIDAFGDKAFDAKAFKQAKQKEFDAKIDAVTELFSSIYATLTPEQRPVFKRAFTAPMVEKMIKQNMIKGPMTMQGGGSKMKCGGQSR